MTDQRQERGGQRAATEAKQDAARSVEQRLADLELANAQLRATTPLGTTPEHGAGPGTEIAETWSQYEQEQERIADAEPKQ